MTTRSSDLFFIQNQLKSGELNLPDLVRFYVENAKKSANLNAFVEIWEKEAIERAYFLQNKFDENQDSVGQLFGAVISIKDNICFEDHVVSAGSRILENFKSTFSATVVERVLSEDAILIGRTSCDQFGMGSSNENTIYNSVKNAIDPTRVPGGSSGGAAVSVQTEACLAAIGTDTGGSIRQPAGFCGLIGLKPTYGRVSRHGLVAYGSSFDCAGIISKNVADAARILEVIQGADDWDMTVSQTPVSIYFPLKKEEKKWRVAYFSAVFSGEGMEAGVKKLSQNFLQQLDNQGVIIENVTFDLLDFVVPTYYVLTTAEASSNLSRYDGIRFGRRAEGAKTLDETYILSRSEGFSEEVKRRILLGTFVLSSGFYDAYYQKAQQVRQLIRSRILEIFESFDFIALPTAPMVAWRFGEKSADPTAMYLADIFTVLANLAGVPAINFSIGNDPETGMPIGMQLLGKPFAEADLLNFSADFLEKKV
jgi:aspartyl-tRNA(Asn)/glutamyl-tRNA(Gln) amidotransferase subunit A